MGPGRQIIKFILLITLIASASFSVICAQEIPGAAQNTPVSGQPVTKIIYILEDSRFLYQIGAMDPDGGNKKNLTDEGNNWCPCVSPGGDKIAFFSDRTGFPNLWEMNSDGAIEKQLTLNMEKVNSIDLQNRGQISWSQDGSVIYFLKDGDIWQIDTGGETPSALTEYHDVTSFRLSPDKTKALFSREKTRKHNGLWIMNIDKTGTRQITQSTIKIPAFDWGDNLTIAYFNNRGIAIIDSGGMNKKLVKETYYLDNDIEWSKNTPADEMSCYIAYISDKNNGPNIWIMKPDGSGEQQITDNGGFSPCWFPDGSSLVYVEGSDLYCKNLKTKSVARLTYNFSAYYPVVAEINSAGPGLK